MELKGFTPAADFITEEHGGIISLIYGAMWRYSQQSPLALCTASQTKIGKRAGVERETVNRNIPDMLKKGLIELSGKAQGGVNSYKCVVDLNPMFSMGVIESHNESELESHPPVRESHIKKEVKERKESNIEAIQKGQALSSAIQGAFREHLGLAPNWDTKTNQAHYQFFRERYQAGQSVREFAEWWAGDWKGKEGSLPSSIGQVQSLWLQAFIKKQDETHYRKPL